jgi:hypothetical protein
VEAGYRLGLLFPPGEAGGPFGVGMYCTVGWCRVGLFLAKGMDRAAFA